MVLGFIANKACGADLYVPGSYKIIQDGVAYKGWF